MLPYIRDIFAVSLACRLEQLLEFECSHALGCRFFVSRCKRPLPYFFFALVGPESRGVRIGCYPFYRRYCISCIGSWAFLLAYDRQKTNRRKDAVRDGIRIIEIDETNRLQGTEMSGETPRRGCSALYPATRTYFPCYLERGVGIMIVRHLGRRMACLHRAISLQIRSEEMKKEPKSACGSNHHVEKSRPTVETQLRMPLIAPSLSPFATPP